MTAKSNADLCLADSFFIMQLLVCKELILIARFRSA